ncbi:hypothetical protein [Herbinix luporum]|uniref:Uncharacterized protein n=1 Tax=Herbinix luporum TaxID=1679721 RepID=A0A0K8J625_9FIRM|nr:hypothetical protein [Herbinix luporum]CUH93126.1 hypothetical protein SD1D_1580 [Herbinix luporum]
MSCSGNFGFRHDSCQRKHNDRSFNRFDRFDRRHSQCRYFNCNNKRPRYDKNDCQVCPRRRSRFPIFPNFF